jgi:hypothetical protein
MKGGNSGVSAEGRSGERETEREEDGVILFKFIRKNTNPVEIRRSIAVIINLIYRDSRVLIPKGSSKRSLITLAGIQRERNVRSVFTLARFTLTTVKKKKEKKKRKKEMNRRIFH